MATVSEQRARLRARLAELDDERKQINYALQVLDQIEVPSAGRRKRQPGPSGPSTVDLTVELIKNGGQRTWRVVDVIEALEANGWGERIVDKQGAVRTALTRAYERDLIGRHGQGEYVPLDFVPPASDTNPFASDDPWATPVTGTMTAQAYANDEEPPF